MNVREAITTRKSVRAFLNRQVDIHLVERIVADAARAPSGGNLQPWHIHIVAGASMARLKAIMQERLKQPDRDPPEYSIYPDELPDIYRTRRFERGEGMFAVMGITRQDKAARRLWFEGNYDFYGAPAGLFCTVERCMGPPQWSDLGMFLQSVMLLAHEAGLATCAQECWAVYPRTVRSFLSLPADQILFCGMSIGYEDEAQPVNAFRSSRANLSEWLSIHR